MDEGSRWVWLRWPLVPFATVLGYAVGAAAVSLMIWLQGFLLGHDLWGMLKFLAAGGAGGYVGIALASSTAPRAGEIVGIIVATVLIVLTLVGALMSWAQGPGLMPEAVLSSIGGCVGAIAAATQGYRDRPAD